MKVRLAFAVSGFGLAACVMPMLAHHSVPAKFDVSTMITIQGVVTKTEWTNPHARFWVDAKDENGTVSNWELELPAPNALKKEGVGMDFVKQGDQVSVSFWRARDGSRVAHALTLTVPDGRVMNFPRDWGTPTISK
jgi:hypothetical protein